MSAGSSGGGGWGGGPGVDSVREACLTLLPSLRLSDSLKACCDGCCPVLNFKEVPQIQFFDVGVLQFLDKVGLWSRQYRKLFGGSWWFRRP